MARERRYRTPEESFDARIHRDESGCWLWTGYIDPKGYGVIGVGGRKLSKVHRYSYERFIGPVPDGLQLDHLCRVRHCANPAHLEPVTNRENVIRGNAARPDRTHCNRGHEFNEENTYINPKGRRECRVCRHAASIRYKEKAIGTRN
jgi:hypothetical protein